MIACLQSTADCVACEQASLQKGEMLLTPNTLLSRKRSMTYRYTATCVMHQSKQYTKARITSALISSKACHDDNTQAAECRETAVEVDRR
jgi:hypothetical protein